MKTYSKRGDKSLSRLTFVIGASLATIFSGLCSAQSKENATITSEPYNSIPVLLATDSVGDAGAAILGANFEYYKLQEFPSNKTKALVYGEIDQLDTTNRSAMSALNMAKDLRWPIVLESTSWNVNALHAFVEKFIPEIKISELKNVAVRLEYLDGAWNAKDTEPTEVALSVGTPLQFTELGRAKSDITEAKEPEQKGLANPVYTETVDRWVELVRQTYDTTPTSTNWQLLYNGDVVDVWKERTNGGQCVVAWRGSASLGDWYKNSLNATFPSVHISGTPLGQTVGKAYNDRLNNKKYSAYNAVSGGLCSEVRHVGHSLGGAMAQVATYDMIWNTVFDPDGMSAYNPARVGNAAWAVSMTNRLGPGQSLGTGTYHIYCRSGDPVWNVPAGLYHGGGIGAPYYGCTHWGARKFGIDPFLNHYMYHWIAP